MNELLEAKFREYVIEREKEVREISLVERLLRVEEELKSLRELQGRRFEALLREMNARFEASNTRFEALQRDMNSRFINLAEGHEFKI